MGRVCGKESFNEGRRDLEELAGIKVQTKAVERVAEGIWGSTGGAGTPGTRAGHSGAEGNTTEVYR
jgi:hypothetical protein